MTATGKTTIVRYTNRKLYNKDESQYVTLPKVLALGVGNFVILDHKTGGDITSEILIHALYGRFQANPGEFEKVKDAIVETLGLGTPTTN